MPREVNEDEMTVTDAISYAAIQTKLNEDTPLKNSNLPKRKETAMSDLSPENQSLCDILVTIVFHKGLNSTLKHCSVCAPQRTRSPKSEGSRFNSNQIAAVTTVSLVPRAAVTAAALAVATTTTATRLGCRV